MIRGEWIASVGSIDSSTPCVGSAAGDKTTVQYSEARLRTGGASGDGSWQTPIISGNVSSIVVSNANCLVEIPITILDEAGAIIFSVNVPAGPSSLVNGAAARSGPATDASGSSNPVPVSERLTITCPVNDETGDAPFTLRIYVNPAGS